MRHGCKTLVNFEIVPQPPLERSEGNPWPEFPMIFKIDYGHEEAAARFNQDPRVFSISSVNFIDDGSGHISGINTIDVVPKDGRFEPVEGTERHWEADLVFLALGYRGPEHYVSDPLSLEYDERTNYKAEKGVFKTTVEKVFACGDCRGGQSLVVRAINEGREAAHAIDNFLADPNIS